MKKGFIGIGILITVALIGSLLIVKNTIDTNKKIEEVSNNLGSQNAVGGKTYHLSGSGISSSATSIGLTKFEIAGGSQKLRMADFGTLGCATIQPGNSTKQEFVSFTGVTQNSDGTATLTGVSRGLAPIPDYTASTTLQTSHAGNSVFVISNSPPCFYEGYANVTQNETVTGAWNFSTNLPYSALTASTSQQFVNKGLLDATTNAGAATSTETNGGIVELATLAEVASSTASTSAKPLVVQAEHATSTRGIDGTYIVMSENDGKINQNWLDLTEDFAYTGASSHTATTTFNSGVDIEADSVAPLILNGISYVLPSVQGASSTSLYTNGSGTFTWNYDGWDLLGTFASTSASNSITASGFDTRKSVKIIAYFETRTGSEAIKLRFNGDEATNYGYRVFEDYVVVRNSASDYHLELGLASTSPVYLTLDIPNIAGQRKAFTFFGNSSNGKSIDAILNGAGVWNDATNAMTQIRFYLTGQSFGANSYIQVYGSRN